MIGHMSLCLRLAISTASKLTYIKHNLLLEYADMFKQKEKKDGDKDPEADITMVDDEPIPVESNSEEEYPISEEDILSSD
jgi:hypothetical protein